MADDQLEYVLAQLVIRRRRGDRAECLCPAHDDHQASLSVSRGDDVPVVLHCHAGCSADAVMAALGLSMADLGTLVPRRVRSYYYTDAAGNPVYSVERWVPKTFRPRLPSGVYARPHPAEEVLYRLPDVLAAIRVGATVYLVEGERDCETAREHGLVATTAMSGADQPWLPQFTDMLRGAHLVIVADNDPKGRLRARLLREALQDSTSSVRAVVARYGKDLTDHLLAGYGLDVLDPLPAEGQLIRYSLADVAVLPIRWAWNDWIPAGMLTLIEGDPGEGKSVLTCELAARWSVGADMPDGSSNPFARPVRVGIVSAEDDPARVIKPRIQVAGGVSDRVVALGGMPTVGRYARSVDLELDVEPLRDVIEGEHLRVLVFDPLMAFLGNTRTALDNEVRKVLTPLRYLAEETGCAIVAVRHLRKAGGKAIYAGGGSIAFTGAARSVVIINSHPVNPDQRVLAMTKCNLGPTPTSLAYHVEPERTGFVTAPRVIWDGETSLSAGDLMRFHEDSTSVGAEVRAAVLDLLAIQPLTMADIKKQLHARGVESGESTLRQVLRMVAETDVQNRGLPGAIYRWRLKADYLPDVKPDQDAMTTDGQVDGVVGGDTTEGDGQPNDEQVDGASTPVSNHPDGDRLPPLENHQPPDTPLGAPIAEGDEAIACKVCGSTQNLCYYPDLSAWRCDDHPPAL